MSEVKADVVTTQQDATEQPQPQPQPQQQAPAKHKLTKAKAKKKKQKEKKKQAKLISREERDQAILDQMTAQAAVNKKEAQKQIDPVESKKMDDKVCGEAARLWKFLIDQNTHDDLREDWKKLSDTDKLEMIALGFKEFTNTYPVVSKYMVLFNQYSENAFRRFLKKSRENSPEMSAVGARDKASMAAMKRAGQVKWCENNAWYGVYLWEAYVKASRPNHRIERREQKSIYTQCYDALIGEFDEMDEMKAEAEVTVKDRQVRTDKEAINDVMGALSEGAYKNLDIVAKRELIAVLKGLKAKQQADEATS